MPASNLENSDSTPESDSNTRSRSETGIDPSESFFQETDLHKHNEETKTKQNQKGPKHHKHSNSKSSFESQHIEIKFGNNNDQSTFDKAALNLGLREPTFKEKLEAKVGLREKGAGEKIRDKIKEEGGNVGDSSKSSGLCCGPGCCGICCTGGASFIQEEAHTVLTLPDHKNQIQNHNVNPDVNVTASIEQSSVHGHGSLESPYHNPNLFIMSLELNLIFFGFILLFFFLLRKDSTVTKESVKSDSSKKQKDKHSETNRKGNQVKHKQNDINAAEVDSQSNTASDKDHSDSGSSKESDSDSQVNHVLNLKNKKGENSVANNRGRVAKSPVHNKTGTRIQKIKGKGKSQGGGKQK